MYNTGIENLNHFNREQDVKTQELVETQEYCAELKKKSNEDVNELQICLKDADLTINEGDFKLTFKVGASERTYSLAGLEDASLSFSNQCGLRPKD